MLRNYLLKTKDFFKHFSIVFKGVVNVCKRLPGIHIKPPCVYLHVMAKKSTPLVGIIMGSASDLPVMQAAADILELMGIPYEISVVSAHRTPARMFEYAGAAAGGGMKVIIAGAGGAAHLPGMVASITPLPVIGVPVKSSNSIDGWDSVLSILQMPNGVPVATVALNAAQNAGILAAQIIGTSDKKVLQKVIKFKEDLRSKVMKADAEMKGKSKK
jgi:5-(carboxyamino)imidazole ribonucleotide mutase